MKNFESRPRAYLYGVLGLVIFCDVPAWSTHAKRIKILQQRDTVSYPFGEQSSISISLSGDPIFVLNDEKGVFIYHIKDSEIIQTYQTIKNGRNIIVATKSSRGRKFSGIITSEAEPLLSDTAPADQGSPPSSATSLSSPFDQKPLTGYIKDDIIDQSCADLDPPPKRQLKGIVSDFFNAKTSYLNICFNDAKAKEKIAAQGKTKELQMIGSAYAKDIFASQKGSPDFKVGCESVPKIPSDFAGKYLPNTKLIVFPMNSGNIYQTKCSSFPATMLHEYIHRAGIIPDADVRIFDTICGEANGNKAVGEPSCINVYPPLKRPENGSFARAAQQKVAQKFVQNNIPAANEMNDQIVAGNNAARAASADAVTIRTASNSDTNSYLQRSDGGGRGPASVGEEPISAPQTRISTVDIGGTSSSDPWTGTGPAVDRVSTSISNLSRGMEKLADRAVASVVTPAKASSESLTQNSTDSGKNNETYTKEEILADLGVPAKMPSPGSTQVAGSSAIASSVPVAAPYTPASSAEPLIRSSTTGRSPASIGDPVQLADTVQPAGAKAVSAGNARSGEAPTRGPESSKSNIGGQYSAVLPQGILSKQKEIVGKQYQAILSSYSNSNLEPALDQNNIQILIPESSVVMGSRRQGATVYQDTGRSLVRVGK